MTMMYVVPTRERPENARALLTAWRDTKAGAGLVFAVDEDDPTMEAYCEVVATLDIPGTNVTVVPPPKRRGMVEGLNLAVEAVLAIDKPEYIGFMGDDHRPRTPHWDIVFENEFKQTCYLLLLYGDDLVQRASLPTAVVMRADAIQRLGYMSPPCLQHMYVDNYWLALGGGNRIKYMPQVVIEHVHPITGKAEWDEGYRIVNDGSVYERDRIAFHQFVESGGLAADQAKIKDLL